MLGIDPGLRLTGYGCVDMADPGAPALVEAGVLRLDARAPVGERLVELEADVLAVIDRVRPGVVAIEGLYAHYKHPATAIAMGHARGVLMLSAVRAGLGLVELKPNAVKKAIAGYGHAGKAQIQEAIRRELGLAQRPEPADVADALAIALCAGRRQSIDGVPGARGAERGART